ncbi:MAG TPA: DUF2283 domain-containing protein [Hansschlegelia sp.]
MTTMTSDLEADAAYVRFSHAKVASTEDAGPFIYDVDAEGRIIGHRNPVVQLGHGARRARTAPRPSVAKADAAE